MLIKILVSVIPVILFLIFLVYLDSFNLIKTKYIALCFAWGLVSVVAAFFLNSGLLGQINIDFSEYSKYIAPVVEESLKFALLVYLIRKSKIGFIIDGAIYGFAIGAGFAFLENIFYLNYIESNDVIVWIIRGFGTALMHGGATSVVALFAMRKRNEEKNIGLSVLPGLVIAIIVHAVFNQFFLTPVISTLIILILVPVVFFLVFQNNEKSLRNWLEVEFDTEVVMLNMIRKGKFRNTKTGEFLVSIKEQFSPEVVFDLYCYIDQYLELSIRAKSNLMLKESGLPVKKDEAINQKLAELKTLQKNIGKTGLMAISPVLRMNKKDLWKLSML